MTTKRKGRGEGKSNVTCLSIDCPERTGGKCDVLERVMARQFPDGIAVPESPERRCRAVMDFLKACGWYLTSFRERDGMATFAIFVGDPRARKGMEMRHEIPAAYLASSSVEEIAETFTSLLAGTYARAVEDAAKNGFSS